MVRIDYVKFGEISVDGKIYYSDVIVYWDGRVEYRKKSHKFDINEFLKIFERKPEIIVVGTGIDGALGVPEETNIAAEDRGVKIFKEVSHKAVDMFNAFISDGKRAVAIIHTT